jgi:hypothetical protein
VTIVGSRRTVPFSALILLAAAVGLPGCSAGPAATGSDVPRLRMVVSLYNMARTTTGRVPANEAEFKAFIADKGGPVIERAGVASAEELLVSERDGQPFVVVYGAPPKGMHNDVVAYEQQGVDGKRQVGFGLGMVETVDDAKFNELVPNPPAKN